ncbi:MAG TPA: hypothetical protein VJ801_05865 [Polyangia bacterium]|jgi:hypothetical protein|nr:hypothetical protein [Polyangia bacterium]
MQKHEMVFMVTFALSVAACVSGGGARPDRLYPPTPEPLGPQQVSTLTGYVQFVDGKDVSSLGGYFELLPGCHVIGTPSRWADQSPGGNVVVTANTGRWTFALPMKAGHQYRIEVRAGVATGPTGPLTIKGYESDLRGNKTREFERATSQKDIAACNQEAARSPGPERR